MAFQHRYSAAGLTIPGAKNAVAFGSTPWTPNAGSGTSNLTGATLPTKSDYRGRDRVEYIVANSNIPNCQGARVGSGNTIAMRDFGLAVALQWAYQGRIARSFGCSTNFGASSLEIGLDAHGCLRLCDDAGANVIDFGQALPVPANDTVILLASGAGGTYGKVLGLPAATGGVFANSSTLATYLKYGNAASTRRFGGAIDAEDWYSTAADITGSAAAKEAALVAEFGLTIPTKDALTLGTSIGNCNFPGMASKSWPCAVANAYPQFFWRQMCVSGQTFALATADRANLIDHASIAPITGTPSVVLVELGANELASGMSSANMLTAAASFASLLRTKWSSASRTAIVFYGVLPSGSTAARETIRRAYNSGLAAAVAPYGCRATDPTTGVSAFDTGAGSDSEVAACTAALPYQTRDGSNTLGAGDRLHPSIGAQDAMNPGMIAGAQMAIASIGGGGGGPGRSRDDRRSLVIGAAA